MRARVGQASCTTCGGGNWLDSACNRDGEILSPEGPRRTCSHGGEQRGFGGVGGGVQLAKKSAWNELREASHVSSIHDSPHTETYSWCVFVAPVLLGTASDSPLFNLERAAAERRILEAER